MKLIFSLILITFSIFSISALDLKLINKETSLEYINNTFDDERCFYISKVRNNILDALKKGLKSAVYEYDNFTKEEKKTKISEINEIKMDPDKGLIFVLGQTHRVFSENLNFHFELIDNNGNSMIDSVNFYNLKITRMTTTGTYSGYEYYWFINFTKKINKTNIDKENFPMQFNIIFPNGKKWKYKVKK